MKRARIANPVRQQVESASAAPPAGFAWLQFCFFLSGAAGLVYQVAWTKSLGLLFTYTASSTATAIAAFMAGPRSWSLLLVQMRSYGGSPPALADPPQPGGPRMLAPSAVSASPGAP